MAQLIEVPGQPLRALDRCDRCGAQAYVIAMVNPEKPSLLFCKHHWKEHGDKIKAIPGAMIADHSASLVAASK